MKNQLLALLCLAVLYTILALGLWPFHSPRNEVTWLPSRNGLRFGRYGTLLSSSSFPIARPQGRPDASVEIWLQPRRIWDSGTFLAFYRSGNFSEFSLRQSQTDLLVEAETQVGLSHATATTLYVNDVFHWGRPTFVTLTSGGQEVCVYLDGVLTLRRRGFPLSAQQFTGWLVIGDSPRQPDSWSGQILGLAIYDDQLTARQVLQNYTSWKQNGRPETVEEEGNIALYFFNEHAGRIVRDKSRSALDLEIPEKYQVLKKVALEPFWAEFEMSRNYWAAALKNIVGFIPLGLCFCAYLATLLPIKPASLVTVALGAAVSFTIEILQAFLPTRDSGTTDILTNTLGTWIGVASFRLMTPALVRFFPWLPLSVPRK